MVGGILSGIAAAVFQDCGYLFSRIAVKTGLKPDHLLVFTQILMGGAGLVLLPFFLHKGVPWGDWQFLLFLGGASFGSLGGQYFFFCAEKRWRPRAFPR